MKLQRGFSLLELLVAFSILALSLGMLYRLSGGSMRTVLNVEQQQRATVLAESLLASRDFVDELGWNESGQSGGMDWNVRSAPFDTEQSRTNPQAVRLHELTMIVTWRDGEQTRQLELVTLRPQRKVPNQGLSK